jgi:hypothetical protein
MRRLLLSFLGPLGVVVFLLLAGGCALLGGADSASRQNLSKEILLHPRISLADFHISGYRDNATALDGLRQAATGGPSRRSFYQTAPGGLTNLDVRMLSAMVKLADSGYTIRVTEVAGGSHSRGSRHYDGLAFDIDYINGMKVGYGNPDCRRVMKKLRSLGATEVKGPGDRGHNTHIHIAWSDAGRRW